MDERCVIVVSHIIPVPPSQGNRQAICQLVTWLRGQGYTVLYVIQSHVITPEQRAQMRELVDELYITKDDPAVERTRQRLQVLKKRGFGLPLRFWHWRRPGRGCWPETKRIVKDLCARRGVVAVVGEYIYLTPCYEGLPKHVLTLTQTIDVHSRIREDVAGKGADTLARECSPASERKALRRGNVIIAIQDYEAELFRQLVPDREVLVLGFANNIEPREPVEAPAPGRVLMIGSVNPLNQKGLVDFCEKVWPDVLEQVPDAVLHVVGGVGDALPRETSNAEALGILDNVDTEYNEACVIVNPVELGTGLKIKTVEALTHSKALVTTPRGVEGMFFENDAPCCIADDWKSFSDAVIAVLRDAGLRRTLEKKALSYAREHLSETAVFAELRARLDKHIAQYGTV